MNIFDEEDIENDIIDDIDEKDEISKKENDIDDEKEEIPDEDENKPEDGDPDEYRITPSSSLLRYLRTEVKFKEFSRKKISFSLYSDGDTSVVYNGYPLKELKEGESFIFEILKPQKKMKKVVLNDISMYF